jgi:hypothetical protein
MSDQQPLDTAEKTAPERETSMEEMWAEAAKAFENICGKSLLKGNVVNFDDVQRKIESINKAMYSEEPADKWEKAKNVGLKSLKYLKMLVGAASQATSFVCWISFL